MAIFLEDVRFKNEFYGSDYTPYLLGNIGDKVTIEMDFFVEEVIYTTQDIDVDQIKLFPTETDAQTPQRFDMVLSEKTSAFSVFKVGDRITIDGDFAGGGSINQEYVVYLKLDDSRIKVHTVGGVPGDVDFAVLLGGGKTMLSGSKIYVSTPISSINFKHNFVSESTGNTYESLIDLQVFEAYANGLSATTLTDTTLIFNQPTTNKIGEIRAKGLGLGVGGTAQRFSITHDTYITPAFLAGQIFDVQDGIKPSYFDSSDCLKYIFEITCGENLNEPNNLQVISKTDLNGNTGWFDESFNARKSDYEINSVTYKDVTTATIDSIEATTAEQTIEITVDTDIDFAAADDFVVNFQLAPETVDEYRNNNKDVITNFRFDRVASTMGAAAVAGDNFGTINQVFKEAVVTNLTASQITITATLQMSQDVVDDIASRPDTSYLLWVSVQDKDLAIADSNRVSLLAGVDTFFFNFADPGIVVINNNFLRHYEGDNDTEGTTDLIARKEDDIIAYSRFYIDRLGRETDDIVINSINCELIAERVDGTEFNLETFTQSFNGSLVVGDSQFINNQIARSFKMPEGDNRKTIKIKRRTDLDTADFRYYDVAYPFLFRWEYWSALVGANSDAFDVNEPNNGYNHDWHRYDDITDWTIKYKFRVNLTKNGNALFVEQENAFSTFDYLDDADWINETLTIVDADTETDLNGVIQPNSKLVATMDYAGGTAPLLSEVEWVVRMEVKEVGGISGTRFFSSVYDWSEGSWYKGLDVSNLVIKSVDGVTYKAEALLNYDVIPEEAEFSISARIYDKRDVIEECCLLLESGDSILTENGVDCLAPEDC